MTPAAGKSYPSLRWRLLRAVSVATLLAWSLAGVFSYTNAQREAEELMDGHLAQTARLLLALVRGNEHHLGDLATRLATVRRVVQRSIYEPPLEFQIGQADGTVLLRSPNAPTLPVLGVAGYSDIKRHVSWRVLNMVAADGKYRVQIAQSIELRDRAALEVASQTVYPVLFVLPILLALIYFSIRKALRPLDELAKDIAARTPDTLTRLPERAAPQEVAPLVAALNRLFDRLGQTLENERQFTADAAHELRTPLAALKVQTQVARLSTDPQVREHALRQIENGVDRASRLVNQLLRLARLDPMSHLEQPRAVDLCDVVDEVLLSLRAAHAPRVSALIDELPRQTLLIRGDADLLTIAIRNLIDNALNYSGANSSIRLLASCADGHCALTVRDDGPGVSAALAGRLGERFHRDTASGVEGNGLGLAIVARIAELHGGRLIAGNHPEGGFAATLAELPLSIPSS